MGFDTLTGGSGADVFTYTSISEATFSVGGAKETITDFNITEDVISFSGLLNGVFNFVSSGGSGWTGNSNTEAMFDDASDMLTLDIDGDGNEDMAVLMSNVDEADLTVGANLIVA